MTRRTQTADSSGMVRIVSRMARRLIHIHTTTGTSYDKKFTRMIFRMALPFMV